jgi:putative tryptophan/tyrosine transport system substrate-binding protein
MPHGQGRGGSWWCRFARASGDRLMGRRGFGRAMGFGFLVGPFSAWAQQPGKVYRLGELREGPAPFRKALMEAMRALGWVEGQNFTIETRSASKQDQLPELAAELVRLKVDLILAGGTSAARAAKGATKAIPIVFSLGDDPVGSGLVASFARPGGNLTGYALGLYDEKLLEVLKEGVPGASRVAYAAPAQETGARAARLNAAARVLAVEMRRIVVQGPKDLDGFFAAAKDLGGHAALVPNVAWFRPHLERIGAAAARSRLPAIGYDRQFAESGGLLSYGPESSQNVPRLAAQIDKILKGAKPADLPVEQPTKFELVVNLQTAKAIGLTIPQSVLLRADEVIHP